MTYPHHGIRNRIILISTVPLLAITSMLTFFMVSERHADLENGMEVFGNTTSNYLASSSEFGMYTGDKIYLNNLGEGALKINSITGISFIDTNQQLIASQGEIALNKEHLTQCIKSLIYKENRTWYFCRPISSTTPDISDYTDEFDNDKTERTGYGWLVLSISIEEMLNQKQSIIEISTIVSLFSMLLFMSIAVRIGKGISSPILKLSETVKQLRAGEHSIRASETGPYETKYLAQGINQLASSVENSQKELERRIELATRQLRDTMTDLSERNLELESTRDDLEKAMRAKDQFLARMSHELRTPLTTVIGFTHLLHSSKLNREQAEYSEIINHASSLLLSTIDDILDFSKLQSNALTIENIEFDLEECLEDLIAMHAYHAYGKDLELVLIIGVDVPTKLIGDPVRLKQIVNNLMGNAIKFTSKGEVILRASLSQLEENHDNHTNLEFQVIDSGVGISDEKAANLFQPFSQADNSITRRFGGSGLGLVICKQLVDLMGGSIAISSKPDIGSEVTFELPFVVANNKASTLSTMPLHELRLLAYDSHPWSRRALRSQLARWTGNVFTAGTATQTIKLIEQQEQSFHLLVLGLNPEEVKPTVLSELLSTIRIVYTGPVLLLACINNIQSKIPQNIIKDYSPIYCLSKPVRREALVSNLEIIAGKASAVNKPTRSIVTKCLDGLNVLIAEDNSYNRNLIKSIIELFGAKAIEASDGYAAVEIFRATPCDVVLMDVHMPNMDGIEATKNIIELAGDKPIPIIGLTANVIENEEKDLFNAGAIDILYKPVDEQALAAKICEHTGRKHPTNTQQISIFGAQAESVGSLKEEILRLVKDIRKLSQENRMNVVREKIHELLGLAGLFDMQEIRVHVKDLQKSMINNQPQNIEHLLTMIESETISFRINP